MAEVAGLVLGGIPLAIWALEKYIEPLEDYHRYHRSIESFRADLIVQNRHLQTTFCSIGLDREPSMEELRECFETKFSSISRELMSIVQRMDDVTAGLMKNLDIDVNGKPDTLPDRAQWEWRRVKHALSASKRKKVIEDLRNWNKDLERCVEKPEVPAEDDSGKVRDLKRRFNIQRSDSIRNCLSSLHRALESGFCCACSPPHQAAIDLDWAAYESDTAKPLKVAVSYGTISHLPGSWRKLQVTSCAPRKMVSSVPRLPSPSPPPARALSPPRSFLGIKFRPRSRTPSPLPTPSDSSLASTAVSTPESTEISNLCAIVGAECNPWTLAGFLKDPDMDQDRQFSFDHSKTDVCKIIKAVPLKSLLSSQQSAQQQSPYTSLSLKQRLGIAASTAWSVLHLSGSPWLGNHWDEKQAIIFLESMQGKREVLSRNPCASCVFPSPTTPAEPPTNEFSHIIPNRTVFALGILLIELCINKSFAEIRQTNGSAIPASLLDDYQTAVIMLDEVYRTAGDSYGDATTRNSTTL
ncbi:hypothetical protein N7530_008383 [Penicillium desertorum]|uniref:DUF7580 domain-containing protein n=1 Tax=Penicillium desertorum TaxID=1303715 RepID=A0A9W9WP82_9EURO|nr:hypothetical protein N7530_008383 [Penicillium desertorum]